MARLEHAVIAALLAERADAVIAPMSLGHPPMQLPHPQSP